MKHIVLLVSMLISFNVCAIGTQDLTGFSNLTDVQKAEVAKLIAQTAAQNTQPAAPEIPAPEDFEKYAKIGEGIAKSLGAAMKELNVQSNEFLTTPVGMITTGLIVYKVLGEDVLDQVHGIIQSFFFTLIWVSYLIWFVRRSTDIKIKYSDTKTNIFGNPKIESYDKDSLSDERAWAITICSAICLAISVILL